MRIVHWKKGLGYTRVAWCGAKWNPVDGFAERRPTSEGACARCIEAHDTKVPTDPAAQQAYGSRTTERNQARRRAFATRTA